MSVEIPLADDGAPLGFAMVARPFDPAAIVDLPYPPYPLPFGESPSGLYSRIVGARATVVASTHGFVSGAGDDPPHTHFPALMSETLNFGISLLDRADPALSGNRGAADMAGKGVLLLDDANGELDAAAIDYSWDNRELVLWRGDNRAAFSTWTAVARLRTAGIEYNRRQKRILLRDLQGPLYATPLLDRYNGAGDLGGDAAAKGNPIPQAYGVFFNAAPRCIDVTHNIYQWHDRRSDSLTDARDGANDIPIDGDEPDIASLRAAVIPDGHARTCLAHSLIRTKLTPALGLRVDGKGDAQTLSGIAYVEKRGQIARRIATTRGASALSDPGQIDTAAFSALDTAQPAAVGYWFGDDISIGDALDRVMSGCAGAWWVGLDGRMVAGALAAPASEPDFILEHPVDFDGEFEMASWSPPRWRTRVGYQRNYAPQTPVELGESTTIEQSLYGDAWRWGQSADETVRTRYPTALEPDVDGGYALSADATSEAARQQALFGVRRELWSVTAVIDPLAQVLGDTVEVRNYNRLGFGAARRFRVVGIEAVVGLRSVKLKLWG